VIKRRPFVFAAISGSALAALTARAAQASDTLAARLREGGVVIAFRHALAPGTFDPPGFKLGDCATQRNLDDEGRAQARRIGQWFTERRLVPAAVRSSPWCRCVDTATLAFGRADSWPALGSPHGVAETTRSTQLDELRRALAQAATRRGRFEAWVTHQFVLRDLTGESTASGEALLLAAEARGSVRIVERALLF